VASGVAFVLALAGYARTTGTPHVAEARVYAAVSAGALFLALAIHLFLRRSEYAWWVGFVTSLVDVTIVTACLVGMLVVDEPLAAVNNPVAYPVYFVALAATGLRLDARACAAAGAAAVVGYSAVVVAAALHPDPASTHGALEYGRFGAANQGVRILLLAATAGIGTTVNLRMQTPHILSANDALTRLMNRRAFEDRWEGEVARARRYGRPISLAAIDIDYFKHYNDSHGHAAGDLALQSVARVIRGRIRAGDFAARMGGEEFVVALPETNAASALSIAEALRRAVSEVELPIPGSRTPGKVTVSIGVASWPEHGQEIGRLMERADERLYEAKLAGRDQVKGPLGAPDHEPRPAGLY
jgi:diguanylate cyclase (GGDEF)-like protein